MSGLLNMGPQDEALLALGLGLLNSKGSFGNALGQAGMQSLGVLNQAKERQQLQKQRELQEQAQQLRVQEMQRSLEQQRKAEQEQARVNGLIQSAVAPVSPIEAGASGPTTAAAATIGQRKPIDFVQLIAMGVPFERAKQLAEAPNLGREEIAGQFETTDARGRPVTQFRSKYAPMPGAFPKPYEKKFQDLGGTVGVLDPYAVASGANFKKTQTPDSIASNAVTMRGQNMADARAREANAASLTKPFEVTGPDGLPMLVQQDKQGNLRKVEGFGPKSGSAKPLTDAQAKALLFGSRAKEADRLIGGLGDKYSPLMVNAKTSAGNFPLIGGALEATANVLTSSENQQAEQAQRDFVNAVLRRESGAVISEPEFNNAKKQYFPQPGDSEATIKQKARNRALAVEGILAEVPVGQRSQLDRAGGAGGGWTVTEVK